MSVLLPLDLRVAGRGDLTVAGEEPGVEPAETFVERGVVSGPGGENGPGELDDNPVDGGKLEAEVRVHGVERRWELRARAAGNMKTG